jgi:hypothetical protein
MAIRWAYSTEWIDEVAARMSKADLMVEGAV